MTGEVIQSFLVGLGFEIDQSSLSAFNKAISSAALKVSALYTGIQVASTGIAFGISKISESFEDLGYEYKIIAPAINKALILRQEMIHAYSAAGVNIVKVVQSAVKLNISLTKTKYAFEALYKSTASRFFDILTKQSDAFRRALYNNMPKIQGALERFVKFIFKAFEATTALGLRLWSILTRVYDFFVMLDKATDGWSTIILGVIAAWKLLNLSFLATPLGLLITGFVALLALWDDFKTFQEGGQSFFDWSKAIPIIDAVTDSLKSLWSVVSAIVTAVYDLFQALYKLSQGDFNGAFQAWARAGDAILQTFRNLWETIKNIGGLLGALGGAAINLVSGSPNVAANLQNTPNGSPSLSSPLGATNNSNSQTNQHVQQQTNINVMGAADASSVGKRVASEQGRVNFDMARNFKEAAQ